MSNIWSIEHNNNIREEWWTVSCDKTDFGDTRSFNCSSLEEAEWLCEFLNNQNKIKIALIDALGGLHDEQIRDTTNLPIERCKEIIRLVSEL